MTERILGIADGHETQVEGAGAHTLPPVDGCGVEPRLRNDGLQTGRVAKERDPRTGVILRDYSKRIGGGASLPRLIDPAGGTPASGSSGNDDSDDDSDDADYRRGRPKRPRGGGDGDGSGSGGGAGLDSGSDGVSDEDRDRLKDLFDKS